MSTLPPITLLDTKGMTPKEVIGCCLVGFGGAGLLTFFLTRGSDPEQQKRDISPPPKTRSQKIVEFAKEYIGSIRNRPASSNEWDLPEF